MSGKEAIPSLADFAASEPQRVKCRVCMSPLRAEIEDALAKGVQATVIERWARKHHPDSGVAAPGIGRHLREGHAEGH